MEKTESREMCPDIGTLKELMGGRLSYDETARLNRHRRRCAGCRETLRDLATVRIGERPPADMKKVKRMRELHRAVARDELLVSAPERTRFAGTDLDRIIRSLADEDTGRFLVTGGKLKSLEKEIREKIGKMEQRPSLTPEGERSFVTFLAKCVERNIAGLAGAGDEVELGTIESLLASLEGTAAGGALGLGDEEAVVEIADIFRGKSAAFIRGLERTAGDK